MIAGLTTHTDLHAEKTLQWYKMYLYQLKARPFQEIIASRLDSDLEAFSHNPTDGSFAPLPFGNIISDQLLPQTIKISSS